MKITNLFWMLLFFLLTFLPLSVATGDELACYQESASGIIADISTGQNIQPRLYNGKELDRTNNLFWYDFVARPYDPTRGQFTGPDQKAEEYYPWNPFIFCLNNPLKFEDDDGKSAWKRGIKFIYGVGKAVAKDGLKALGKAATYTSTFTDIKENVETIFSSDASIGERIGASISIASEFSPISDVKDAGKVVNKVVHGNSKASTKAQHAYDIFDKDTGKRVKTGVSSGRIRKDGKSSRAESQVRKWNEEAGYEKYESKIYHKEPAGENARDKIYKIEKERARELRDNKELDKRLHQRP